MRKKILKATSYVYEYLTGLLSKGQRTAIHLEVLEKEGLDVHELSQYFYLRRGPYGLINFIGIKKSLQS